MDSWPLLCLIGLFGIDCKKPIQEEIKTDEVCVFSTTSRDVVLPATCSHRARTLDSGARVFCQERQYNGSSAIGQVSTKEAPQSSPGYSSHLLLAGTRAWWMLGYKFYIDKNFNAAGKCLVLGLREMGSAFEVANVFDLDGYGKSSLEKRILKTDYFTQRDVESLLGLLINRINYYSYHYGAELAEEHWNIIRYTKSLNNENYEQILRVSSYPGVFFTNSGPMPNYPLYSKNFNTIFNENLYDKKISNNVKCCFTSSENIETLLMCFQKQHLLTIPWQYKSSK